MERFLLMFPEKLAGAWRHDVTAMSMNPTVPAWRRGRATRAA
jgi:hypothetical protein